jgi:hypothetical protein
MAQLAGEAARFQERGDVAAASARLSALSGVAARVGTVVPASAGEMKALADEYQSGVEEIREPGGAKAKRMKQQVFDAVRAPVAGW